LFKINQELFSTLSELTVLSQTQVDLWSRAPRYGKEGMKKGKVGEKEGGEGRQEKDRKMEASSTVIFKLLQVGAYVPQWT